MEKYLVADNGQVVNMAVCRKVVNFQWLIKVNGLVNGKRVNKLVGVKGLLEAVGLRHFLKIYPKLGVCREDRKVFKYREKVTVTFYRK